MKRQWPPTSAGAIEFLEALNAHQEDNALRQPEWAFRWNRLAADDPDYIVNYLRRKLVRQLDKGPVLKPLGFVFTIAHHERKL